MCLTLKMMLHVHLILPNPEILDHKTGLIFSWWRKSSSNIKVRKCIEKHIFNQVTFEESFWSHKGQLRALSLEHLAVSGESLRSAVCPFLYALPAWCWCSNSFHLHLCSLTASYLKSLKCLMQFPYIKMWTTRQKENPGLGVASPKSSVASF